MKMRFKSSHFLWIKIKLFSNYSSVFNKSFRLVKLPIYRIFFESPFEKWKKFILFHDFKDLFVIFSNNTYKRIAMIMLYINDLFITYTLFYLWMVNQNKYISMEYYYWSFLFITPRINSVNYITESILTSL